MVKNCTNPTPKADLEIGLTGGRLDDKPVANEGGDSITDFESISKIAIKN
jgi:hypothetical protein